MSNTETFAEKLKKAKKAAGITQQGMAESMLIPKRTIEEWERGKNVPPVYIQRFVLNELESIKNNKAKNCPIADDGLGRAEPIIDRATYTRVQKKLKEQRETKLAPPPLGYRMEGGKLIVDEEEAEVVKRAADEMARDGNLSLDTEKDLLRLWKQHYSE